jgi:tetratricopeptide (TPR) repeat protein
MGWLGMAMPRFFAVVVALAAVSSTASASECTMAQMLKSADSVIEPCTQLLANKKLSDAQRADALLIRGRGYHRTKRVELAAQDYEAGAKLAPKNMEIWLSWANAELRLGNGQSYVQKTERAAKLEPNSPRVLRASGAMYENLDNLAGALELYSKALSIDPTEAYALYMRSDLYRMQRKYAEAIADADALVALPDAAINRDGFLDEHGDVRDFRTMALIHRGKLFEETGQTDRAAKDFDAAATIGRSAPALVARAYFLMEKNDASPEALADLEEATRTEPKNASAQFALGMWLTHSKKFDRAFDAFDRAVAARPDFASALRMRARMHRAFERTDEAIEDFIAAIEADPGIVEQSMHALRYAGYWTSPNPPTSFTPGFQDAIRACMLDVTCN